MNISKLIDDAAERQNLSQAKLAKSIGISAASLSNLRTGKGELSDETYIKLAKLAGVDPTEVIIEKHMRKAGPEGRKVWAHLAKALPKSAALLVMVTLVVPNNQADASTFQISQAAQYLLCKVLYLDAANELLQGFHGPKVQ